jgi:hypothetical protein
MSKVKELIDLSEQLKDVRNEHWLHDVIFTFNWWFLLVLTVLPWIVWWRIVDKKRLLEISLYGTMISIISIMLDDIGSYFVLWIYQYQLIPVSPRLNPIDLTVMPVTYMFIYQYFRKWKSFIIAQIVLAFGAAFISEPLFTWMEIYNPLYWKSVYSFFIYIAIGIALKWFLQKVVKAQVE